jgi:hypothetical protein
VVDLDELFGVAESVILVDVPNLEFFWPDDLSEWWSQSTKTAPPRWGDISHWRTSWRGRRSHPKTPPIADDVAEVITIAAILSHPAVLSYPPMCIIVG